MRIFFNSSVHAKDFYAIFLFLSCSPFVIFDIVLLWLRLHLLKYIYITNKQSNSVSFLRSNADAVCKFEKNTNLEKDSKKMHILYARWPYQSIMKKSMHFNEFFCMENMFNTNSGKWRWIWIKKTRHSFSLRLKYNKNTFWKNGKILTKCSFLYRYNGFIIGGVYLYPF